MQLRKGYRKLLYLGGFVLALVLLAVFWNWNWFRPIVEARASAYLGRPVSIGHFDVRLGRTTHLYADDVEIADPKGFPSGSHLATIKRLAVDVEAMPLIRHRVLVLPSIDIGQPAFDLRETPAGEANWRLDIKSSGGSSSTRIGEVSIEDGQARVVIPKLRANFTVGLHTRKPQGAQGGQIVAEARGTYAGQPITGHFVGGALLSLRDKTRPYPIDLQVANGPTHASLIGTVQDPLALQGLALKLEFAGPDMAKLYPLTGIPIPTTPPYRVVGNLDYAEHKVRFKEFNGTMGSSDLHGNIAVDPGRERPLVIADLYSHRVDLTDLGGFIGAEPGHRGEPGETREQRERQAAAAASPSLFPTTPIDLPKLRSADVRLHYRGEHIEGRSMPLDNLVANLDITDGRIALVPLDFGIGRGQIRSKIWLNAQENLVHAKAGIDFRQVDLSRIMNVTHAFHGSGLIGGSASIDATGNSIAQMMARGNGELKLFMNGGDLSALLVDLSGLEFGNALLSALGVPKRADIRCMVTDLVLRDGIVDTKVMALDTNEADIHVTGDVDLRNETIDLKIQTRPTHFSIGSLPAPIDVTGKLKSPSIRPELKALGIRGAVAAALGFVFAPLALLPTIQLGLGEHNDCTRLFQTAAVPPARAAR